MDLIALWINSTFCEVCRWRPWKFVNEFDDVLFAVCDECLL